MITFVIKRWKKMFHKVINKDKSLRQDDLDLFINSTLKQT